MTAFRRTSAAGPEGEGGIGAADLAKVLRPLADSAEEREMIDQVEHWSNLAESSGSGHYVGVQAYAQNCLWEFADAAPAWTLHFGAEPQLGCGGPAAPALLARALKARFFEAVLGSRKRLRRGGRMPLVGYVADECHRFVTSDTTHGEQSFLDTCRSFGAFCVLACQSVSSLTHALAGDGGGAARNEAAVSILLNNTGTKVVHLRPPSALLPGECYAALADGRFERRRLDPYGGAGADAEEAPPAPEAAAKANGLRPNRNGRGIDG